MARPSKLADPEFAQLVAEAFASGASRKDIAEQFGVRCLETISIWRRDPRVKVPLTKIMEDRVLQITRKIDASIEARLGDVDKMTVKELLDIRKEYLGGTLRSRTENIDDDVIGEAMEALEDNPAIMDEIDQLLQRPKEEVAV